MIAENFLENQMRLTAIEKESERFLNYLQYSIRFLHWQDKIL